MVVRNSVKDMSVCPNCKKGSWKSPGGTYFEMNATTKAAVTVGNCRHCGLGFIETRAMTAKEVKAETARLQAQAEAELERRRIAEIAERREAERQEREIAEILAKRKRIRAEQEAEAKLRIAEIAAERGKRKALAASQQH